MVRRSKRFLSAVVSMSLVFGTVPAVFAGSSQAGAGGTDISGHWAESYLQEFLDAEYIKGDDQGLVNPDGTMTRAQFAAIINRMMGYTEKSDKIGAYTDVAQDAWYHDDMAIALEKQYMNGTGENTMSPDSPITREQGITMIARIMKLENQDLTSLEKFADNSEIADYAKGYLAAMADAGYVSGDSSGNMLPKKSLTRAEGVTVLSRSGKALAEISDEETPLAGLPGLYKDGVYTGTGAAYGGTMTVQVTISDGKISDIQITKNSETGSYLTRAKTLLQKIIDNNGTKGISAVSGATRSSNGIFDAVNACLSQAQGGEDTSTKGSTGGGHGGSGNATVPSNDDVVGKWADGVYSGTAQGYSSSGITAQVTVAGGKITDIQLTNNGETSSYYNSAVNGNNRGGVKILDQIMNTQSTNNIDTVSGATRSSYAVINAVKAALKQASDAAGGADTVGNADAVNGDYKYVLMNIPYEEFYEILGLENDRKIDAVTSATNNKWKNMFSTVAYTKADDEGTGGRILGVRVPVLVSSDYDTGAVSLESEEYYCTAMEEAPSFYLQLAVGENGNKSISLPESFKAQKLADAAASFSASSRYGDFQFSISGAPSGNVYGVMLTAEDADGNETDYGLRHLENIWRGGSEISWSVGISTKEVHGNVLSYDHYALMMGQTIKKITFITDSGLYTIDTDTYVPLKFSGSVSVADAAFDAGETEVSLTGFPEDFVDKVIKITANNNDVTESGGFALEDNKLTWKSVSAGSYTLTVSDPKNKYCELSATFVLNTEIMPASYDAEAAKIVAAEGFSEDELSAYLNAIQSVYVGEKAYSKSGRGAVQIIGNDGSIKLDAVSSVGQTKTPVFAPGNTYEITVKATGYKNDLHFTLSIPAEETAVIEEEPAALAAMPVLMSNEAEITSEIKEETGKPEEISSEVVEINAEEAVTGPDDKNTEEAEQLPEETGISDKTPAEEAVTETENQPQDAEEKDKEKAIVEKLQEVAGEFAEKIGKGLEAVGNPIMNIISEIFS